MNAERMKKLDIALKRWNVDIENGIVTTRKGVASVIGSDGYVRVGMTHKGEYTNFGVHEVIAYAGGLDILDKEVNHKDGNKVNNRIDNLEAVTRKENIIHSFETGLNKAHKGSQHGQALLNEQQVNEIRESLRTGGHGIGTELAKKYGVHKSTITAIKKGRCWK